MYYLFDLNTLVIILAERRGYIQYCGVVIQYYNAFPILPKPVIFNTNQEISLFANIYLINPSYMKEKKSIIDLCNIVLFEDLCNHTGLRHSAHALKRLSLYTLHSV